MSQQDNHAVDQEHVQGLKSDSDQSVQKRFTPHYPNWPTSRPGPLSTIPGVGNRPINAYRSEQMAEIGYDQETGTPVEQSAERYWPDEDLKGRTGFDQARTAQEQARIGDDPRKPWSRKM
jgi:hypothetical protein